MLKTFVFVLLIAVSGVETFTGKVIKITDGDTIVVLNRNREQIKIRLEGIDCPESHQEFGEKAKQALRFNRNPGNNCLKAYFQGFVNRIFNSIDHQIGT
jgi:hypothetical protein